MFDYIKRFFNSLFPIYKRSNRIENNQSINKSINNNKSSNKDNNMLDIVIPGHYCSKDTINSKVKNIIRIIGPNNKRQGYWFDDSGRQYNENILLDDYVLLDTKTHQPGQSFSKAQVRKRKDIMGDFKPVKINEDLEDDYDTAPYSRKLPEHLNPNSNPNPVNNHQTEVVIEQKPVDPLAETKKLIEKASIESLNKNYEKKYGTTYYRAEVITVPIQIEIPYELNKLSQICELFELDTKEVAQIIFNNIRLPEEVILSIILDKINNPNTYEQIRNQQPIQQQVQQSIQKPESKLKQPEPKQIQQNESLTEGISEIDDYLKNMFGK